MLLMKQAVGQKFPLEENNPASPAPQGEAREVPAQFATSQPAEPQEKRFWFDFC